MKEIKTLQPYNFRELPLEMKEKAEKMIADISPLGEVNEGTVDAVEAWCREDVLVLMRAMYNEALRQSRPAPAVDCPLKKSDREIMHEAIDKICDAQEKPHADDVDTSRVIYREATPDGKTREIFVHAFSIIK